MEIFPEEKGFNCEYSFVKGNPLNNQSYLILAGENIPHAKELLFSLDKEITKIDPGYNIAQIKTKFGDLCFYVDLTVDDKESINTIHNLINKAVDDYNVLVR